MTRVALPILLTLLLAGCCMGGAVEPPAAPPSTAPPSAVPPSSAPTAPPAGPDARGCADQTAAIVGVWTHEGLTEEYRADGTYRINGQAGTYRWVGPGRAVLDLPAAGLTGEFHLGLADPITLIAVDSEGAGTVYTRSTPPPQVPPSCFDLSTAFVGNWLARGGQTVEIYRPDGTYQVAGAGRWSFAAPGRLQLVREDGVTSQYHIAMPSHDVALAVSLPPLAPAGVVYARQP